MNLRATVCFSVFLNGPEVFLQMIHYDNLNSSNLITVHVDLVYKPMFNKTNNIFKNTFVDPFPGLISWTMSATI